MPALLLITLACGAQSRPEAAASAGDEMSLQVLSTYLDELTALRAEFRQEVISRDLERLEDSRGHMALKKPGRFRWDYLEPFERVISADGERVWLYEADLEQVTIRRFDSGLGATPAALLTGATDVLEHFAFAGARTEDSIRWLSLVPRSPESDFAGVDLGFTDGELLRIYLTDRLGQQTRITLSAIDRHVDIDDDYFRFEIPEGVDVIDEDDI